MRVQSLPQRPWETRRPSPSHRPLLPDFNDLDDAPQLGAVSLVGAAAHVAAAALLSQHGPGPHVADEITHNAECVIPVLARVLIARCDELVELVDAYRVSLQLRDAEDESPDDPF